MVREELAMESEIAAEHFPLPQPFREDYHPWKSHPKGGPISEKLGAVLLQSGEHNKGEITSEKEPF